MEEPTVGQRNLEHALENSCHDPDCELHHPEVIETSEERWTAKAWFYAGACALVAEMEEVSEVDQVDRTELTPERVVEEAMNDLRQHHGLHNNWP